VAIVAGGGSGIGEATCHVFAAEGATVAVLDIDAGAAKEVAASLPGTAIGIGVDVSQSAQVNRAVDETVARLGRLDILMHAAGVDDPAVKERIAQQAAARVPINITADLSDESWHRIISTNLDGAFFMVRAALRHMVPTGAGTIIVVGSTSGINGYRGHAHYSASKGGVHALCRSVAAEVAARGIRVNSIAPGATDTPMRRRKPVTSSEQDATASALGRPGRPNEIAKVALFLASDDSSFVVGETLIVDGGRMRV
jgi:3-oxoacyl-[acyl-carrier protein] reductase